MCGHLLEARHGLALVWTSLRGRFVMVVVMKSGSTSQQVEHVIQLVREMGLKEHVIVGEERTVVAVIGNDRFKDRSKLETVEGVDRVVPILAPYKMASREVKKERTVVPVGKRARIGGVKVGVIAGPCSVEDRGQIMEIAHAVKEAGASLFVEARSSPALVPMRSRDWRKRG